MGAERYTFDTNILFYSIDASDPQKHEVARRLIGLAHPKRAVVLLQTLGELMNAVSRRQPVLLQRAKAVLNSSSRMFSIVAPELQDYYEALDAQQTHYLQYWDAVLWATARRAGCRILLTEDMQDGRSLSGVVFSNPFRMSPEEIDELAS